MAPESHPTSGGAPSAERLLAPGQQLGKYHLLRRLAIGGMAEIFLARVQGLEGFEKIVVLKSILTQHATEEEWVRMFLEEARLAATLEHPNIAQVFDVGREQDVHYFTMEYVAGADLRRIIKAAESRGGVPLDVAMGIMIGAAAGLHYAHDKTDAQGQPLNIVHRDVSPANVLVSDDGAVKIVDFGIAKAAMRRAATRTGMIKGKAGWISPEQGRGEALDRRSDIFSLGLLLYELTTGKAPFTGDNEYAILLQIVEHEAKAPSTVKEGYPAALEAIVMRCLRKNRDDRYATAQELQIDLETFAREEGLTVSSVELGRFMSELFAGKADEAASAATRMPMMMLPRKRRRVWAMAVVLVGLAGGAAGVRGLMERELPPVAVPTPSPPPPPPVHRPIVVPVETPPPVAQVEAAPKPTPAAKKRGRPSAAQKVSRNKKKKNPNNPDLDAPLP